MDAGFRVYLDKGLGFRGSKKWTRYYIGETRGVLGDSIFWILRGVWVEGMGLRSQRLA